MLAQALAARGVSSAGSTSEACSAAPRPAIRIEASVSGYAADIRSWVTGAAGPHRRRCIWVLGHSEGTLMTLAVAADDSDGHLRIVLVSGPGAGSAMCCASSLADRPNSRLIWNAPCRDRTA
jgi:pimeloyl-ACP methyl ester carboxylesterase